ncbi:MAG: gamma-glutamyltransferase [Actinomycetota bacterium]
MNGVVASSDPRAAAVGASVLRNGGNAVDAAVAAVLVLFVVEPHACGPGGDAFLLYAEPGQVPWALDGSGSVPAGLTQEALTADGLEWVPVRGGRSVTVPGAVALLEDALLRFGTRTFGELAGPAIDYARNGFAARRTLAQTAVRASAHVTKDPVLGPLYCPGGDPLRAGQRVVNPWLADTLELISNDGAAVLYRGPIADEIIRRVREDGGYLTLQDMSTHTTAQVEPVQTTFRGATVWELPEPTQGPAVLAALDLIEPRQTIRWEEVLEAIVAGLASAGIDLRAVPPSRVAPAGPRDTTYLAVVDSAGRGASMITSIFADFGSHIGIQSLGGAIQNRAATFMAMRRQPRPGKPPHTTIPGLVTRQGALEYVLGLAGGYVQAQVQVQLLIRLLAEGLDPQPAIDAPRMRMLFGGEIALEPGHPLAETYPEAVGREAGPEGFGAAQCVARRGSHLLGGADPRRDGAVALA